MGRSRDIGVGVARRLRCPWPRGGYAPRRDHDDHGRVFNVRIKLATAKSILGKEFTEPVLQRLLQRLDQRIFTSTGCQVVTTYPRRAPLHAFSESRAWSRSRCWNGCRPESDGLL